VPLFCEADSDVVKKFLAFYGTQMFIVLFTRFGTGPYPEPDESSPQPYSLFLMSCRNAINVHTIGGFLE
jgi:hypothetical protein